MRELRKDEERFQRDFRVYVEVRVWDWRDIIIWLVEWYIGGKLEDLGVPVPFM